MVFNLLSVYQGQLLIFSGINNAISGKIMMMTKPIAAANKNGTIPLKMVARGTSFATPFIINTFMPTGGVISPISNTITMTTPNQIGSYPMRSMIGNRIGGSTPSRADTA